MRLKVVEKFTDKNDRSVKYAPGQVIEIADAERATNLIRKGWCALVSEETQKPENAPKPDKKGKDKGSKKSGKKEDVPANDQDNASGDKEDASADTSAETAADEGTATGDQE